MHLPHCVDHPGPEVVLQARLTLSVHSTDQYWRTDTESNWCCGTERFWRARLAQWMGTMEQNMVQEKAESSHREEQLYTMSPYSCPARETLCTILLLYNYTMFPHLSARPLPSSLQTCTHTLHTDFFLSTPVAASSSQKH